MINRRVALLVPSLANKGPIRVIQNLVNSSGNFVGKDQVSLTVFYFDPIFELKLNCETKPIKLLNVAEYDIIHTHGLRPDFYAFRKRKKIKKHIVTIHNFLFPDLEYTYNGLVSLVFGHIWLLCWKRSDILVTLTDSMKEYYSKYFPKEKLKRIYNGIPQTEPNDINPGDE